MECGGVRVICRKDINASRYQSAVYWSRGHMAWEKGTAAADVKSRMSGLLEANGLL